MKPEEKREIFIKKVKNSPIHIPKTILKYKYNPKDLRITDHLKVVCECKKCHREYDIFLVNALKGKDCSWCSNKNNANKSKERRSKSVSKFWKKNPHPMLGVKHSDETKEKIRKHHKENPFIITEEHRKKLSDTHKGDKNGFYGKIHTNKTKEKISNSLKNSPKVKRGKDSNFYGKSYYKGGKGGYHKNIWLKSSYELAFAKFLDDQNINWKYEKRFDLIIDGKETSYLPDFHLIDFNIYVEVKGYWFEDAVIKFNEFRKQYPGITIIVLGHSELKDLNIL